MKTWPEAGLRRCALAEPAASARCSATTRGAGSRTVPANLETGKREPEGEGAGQSAKGRGITRRGAAAIAGRGRARRGGAVIAGRG